MSEYKAIPGKPGFGSSPTLDAGARRAKFGTAADGWDAYNNWLDRVRQQPRSTSRQAVVSKSLYSISSYKNWADKARSAFDDKG
jgi:hypothetical protein